MVFKGSFSLLICFCAHWVQSILMSWSLRKKISALDLIYPVSPLPCFKYLSQALFCNFTFQVMEKWNTLFIEGFDHKMPLITWGNNISHIICEIHDFGQQLIMIKAWKKEENVLKWVRNGMLMLVPICLKFLKISNVSFSVIWSIRIKNYGFKISQKCI